MKKNFSEKNKNKDLKIKHWQKSAVFLMAFDILTLYFVYFFALWMVFDCNYHQIAVREKMAFYSFMPIYAVICIAVYITCRLYSTVWRYAGRSEFVRILIATVVTALVHIFGISFYWEMSPTYFVLGILLQFSGLLISRFACRMAAALRRSNTNGLTPSKRVMLIGAGEVGLMLLRDIRKSKEYNDRVCCIIDDDRNKWGRYIENVPIVGGRDDILKSIDRFKIDKIYFAISTISAEDKRDILNICGESPCEILRIPGLSRIANGKIKASAMKEVSVEDLLGRDVICSQIDEISDFIKGKTILVTGGGGSIGSELCRQIASCLPKCLIIFDVYENSTYELQLELKKEHPYLNLEVLIGSVRDSRRINAVFEQYKPDVVYHAAAHKHVPLMEYSPCEAVKNNAIGTYKTAYAAMANGCKKFVLISTDKAVNPTNIMGATKRICEMIVQTFDRKIRENNYNDLHMLSGHLDSLPPDSYKLPENVCTEFAAVRFGNVLGSNGSVIPLFKKQIEAGGPVTVTDPEIIRYFMTIPEAVSLVLRAGVFASGGEIFVLDMGSPVKIDVLARNLIKQSGLEPDVDIKIEYTGLRPGEKLYEEKLMAEEGLKSTPDNKIHIGMPISFDADKFLKQLKVLMAAANANEPNIGELISHIVTTYKPANKGSVPPPPPHTRSVHRLSRFDV